MLVREEGKKKSPCLDPSCPRSDPNLTRSLHHVRKRRPTTRSVSELPISIQYIILHLPRFEGRSLAFLFLEVVVVVLLVGQGHGGGVGDLGLVLGLGLVVKGGLGGLQGGGLDDEHELVDPS
jgi:hypothetical protein